MRRSAGPVGLTPASTSEQRLSLSRPLTFTFPEFLNLLLLQTLPCPAQSTAARLLTEWGWRTVDSCWSRPVASHQSMVLIAALTCHAQSPTHTHLLQLTLLRKLKFTLQEMGTPPTAHGAPYPLPLCQAHTHTYPKAIQVMCLGLFKQRMRDSNRVTKVNSSSKKIL